MPIWEETELLHQEERTLYCHQDALEIRPAEPGKKFRMEDTKQVSFAVNESICHMSSSLIYKLTDCWGLQPWKWCTFFHENLARLKIGRHYTICQTAWEKLVAPVIPVEISLRKIKHFTMPLVVSFPAKWPLWNKCRNSILMTCRYPDLGRASDWLCLETNLLKPIRTGMHSLIKTSYWSTENQWWCHEILAV